MHLCDNGKIYFLDVCTPATTEKYIFLMYAPLRQRKNTFSWCMHPCGNGKNTFFWCMHPRDNGKIYFLDGCILAATERCILNAANGRKNAPFFNWNRAFGQQKPSFVPLFFINFAATMTILITLLVYFGVLLVLSRLTTRHSSNDTFIGATGDRRGLW